MEVALVIGLAGLLVIVGVMCFWILDVAQRSNSNNSHLLQHDQLYEKRLDDAKIQIRELGKRMARIEERQDIQRQRLDVINIIELTIIRDSLRRDRNDSNDHDDGGRIRNANGEIIAAHAAAAASYDFDAHTDDELPLPESDERPNNVGGCTQ